MNKYVAYVASYTRGKSKGITIYDVDVKNGSFKKRGELESSNPTYMVISKKYNKLYVSMDFGVSTYEILPNGDLKFLNTVSINGMRASHISIANDENFLFTSGYHDGKMTIVRINDEGIADEVTDEVYEEGIGRIMEHGHNPHVTCATMTPDRQFLAMCDLGIDQVKMYKLNEETGKAKLVDVLRCPMQSAPRNVLFSDDCKHAYVSCESMNKIMVYSYDVENGLPVFELLQDVVAVEKEHNKNAAAATMEITNDNKFLICTNAGDSSASIFKRDLITGKLTRISVLPIGGNYPKDIAIFPDGKHIVCLNHGSGEMAFFKVDFDKGLIYLSAKFIENDTPNCCIIVEI